MADDFEIEVVDVNSEWLQQRDNEARRAFSYKLAHVLQYNFMHMALPTIEQLYQNPHQHRVTFAPDDFGLLLLFAHYDDIAQRGFMARPSKEPKQDMLNRIIWYWNLDPKHSFQRYFRNTRYNILIMIYAWASGFDKKLFSKPGVEGFVRLFVDAWIESLVDWPNYNEDHFYARNSFLSYWKHGSLDLINFREVDVKKMKKISKTLLATSIPDPCTEDPKMFVQNRRNGSLSDADFDKYGPMLAMRWLHTVEENATELQADIRQHNDAAVNVGLGDRYPLTHVDWDSGVSFIHP
jgi:hypothetical protein